VQADVIMVRRDGLHMLSAQDPVQAVVLYGQSSDVDTVLIGGRVVKSQGRLNFAGLPQRMAELLASGERLMRLARSG